MLACYHGHCGAVRSLALKDPPSVEMKNHSGETALCTLSVMGHHECVELLLLEAEAKPDVRAAKRILRRLRDALQPDATAHYLRILRLLVAANCPMRWDCRWRKKLLSAHFSLKHEPVMQLLMVSPSLLQ